MSITDHDTLLQAQQQQAEAMNQLEALTQELAHAIVVSKLTKERIEVVEMKLTAEFLAGGDSAAASKIKALASPRYAEGMKKVMAETEAAHAIIQRNDVLKEKLNSCCEVMANERAKMKL